VSISGIKKNEIQSRKLLISPKLTKTINTLLKLLPDYIQAGNSDLDRKYAKCSCYTKSASITPLISLSPLLLYWSELCAWSGSLRQAATRLRFKKGVVNPDLALLNTLLFLVKIYLRYEDESTTPAG
jgi:hypothetical protein